MPSSAAPRRTALSIHGAALLCLLPLSTGCDRVKNMYRTDNADPRWQGDSTLLASHPEFLFRVRRENGQTRIVPIASVGARGFHTLNFTPRAWKAFDLEYLHGGSKLTAYRDARPAGTVITQRGMWEPTASPLDTFPGCQSVVPVAKADVESSISLLTSGKRPPIIAGRSLGSGELAEALATVPTLIAPIAGISSAQLARYRRDVHVVNSGNAEWPSIVLIYNDPDGVADSVQAIAQRPRYFMTILDHGRYGYRPTYTYNSVGNAQAALRFYFVGAIDVDDDGKAELFFGTNDSRVPKKFSYTVVFKFQNDVWREVLRYDGAPCQQ